MNNCTNFIYFNPNPECKNSKKRWNRGDCVIRAICKVTGMTWEEVFKILCEEALKLHDIPNGDFAMAATFKRLGFVKGESLKPARGERWPLVKDMAKKFKGQTILCNCVGHIVCCKDGKYHDTWDCGDYTTRSYWIKK